MYLRSISLESSGTTINTLHNGVLIVCTRFEPNWPPTTQVKRCDLEHFSWGIHKSTIQTLPVDFKVSKSVTFMHLSSKYQEYFYHHFFPKAIRTKYLQKATVSVRSPACALQLMTYMFRVEYGVPTQVSKTDVRIHIHKLRKTHFNIIPSYTSHNESVCMR
jgi:hypothetical protein